PTQMYSATSSWKEISPFVAFSSSWLITCRTSLPPFWKLSAWPAVWNPKSTRPAIRTSLLVPLIVPVSVDPPPKSHVPVAPAASRSVPPASVVSSTFGYRTLHFVTVHSPTTHRSTAKAAEAADDGPADGGFTAVGERCAVPPSGRALRSLYRKRATVMAPATRTTTVTVSKNNIVVSGPRARGSGGVSSTTWASCGYGGALRLTGYESTAG